MNSLYPWQNTDWQRLQELQHRLPHALLFKGGQGIGKFDLALSFARSLLCEQPDVQGKACQQCSSCHWFAQGSHPDFKLLEPGAHAIQMLEMENVNGRLVSAWTKRVAEDALEEQRKRDKKPSKEIVIEQARSLTDFLGSSAHQGGGRVVVIYPAEAMNSNTANALLKTLEEPGKGLIFVLVTHKPQQLLPTILSRCLSFAVTQPDAAAAQRWLAEQGVAQPAEMLAQAGFAPLLALELSTQDKGAVRGVLLEALTRSGGFDWLALAEKLQKAELPQVVHGLQQWCHDLASMRFSDSVRYHLAHEATLRKLAAKVEPIQLMNFQRDLLTARRESHHPLNPRLFLESLFAAYQHCYPTR